MDFSKFANMPIVDAHVHFSDVRLMPNMLELMDRTGSASYYRMFPA